jgi:hypothetical protein
MNDLLPKILFVGALAMGAYAYGMLSAEWQSFPYPMIDTARTSFTDLQKNWKNDLEIEPTRHLKPARHDGEGVTVRKDGMQPGWTFITGMFGDQMAARLVDDDGEVVHEWPVNYTGIWPEKPNHPGGEPATDWNVFLHGSIVRPDGSIVINFDEGASLVKLDRCAEVVWKIDQNIHHSVFEAEDGTFWSPKGHNVIVQVSADGEILRSIDIKRMMRRNGLEGALFVHTPRFPAIHPNDVELLSTAMADAFPMFEAGDVVYSMRDLNALMVFDPEREVVKWYKHGPWLRQHDPDFLPDGRISVYNNRMEYGQSNIMTIDPVTEEFEVVYKGSTAAPFYSAIRGKHQTLDNGNILIVESMRGRVFEVDPEGEIVWQYVNRYDDERIGVVSNAIRRPPAFFEVEDWSAPCPEPAVIAKREEN